MSRLDGGGGRLAAIEGQVPGPLQRPAGCGFAEHCPFADAHCHAVAPALRSVGPGHLGVPIGLATGFLGGWVDGLISRITDAFLACPFLILAIALAAVLGPSLQNAMIAIGISTAPIFVRLTRAQVINILVEDNVEAARAVGNPPWRIALRHVLPNSTAPVMVQATLAIALAVIAEAGLSFLGLGQQPPAPSWGSMLNTARNCVDNAPWMSIWPGMSIFVLVLSFKLLGDGLRDALDPRQR